MSEIDAGLESKKFDTEVGKILHLMIHSLYTNKEIFLRELISNASDACDKLRYLAQTDTSLIGDAPDLSIKISFDKEKRIIKITDNGIGMNKEDLIENIGTIARSGTQNFVEKLTGDDKKDNMLIGQFGVGFYSSFMIADKVEIITKKAGEKETYIWSSIGDGEYKIGRSEEDHKRGTSITLHIKEDAEDFLDHFRLKHIIKTYSDHISVPIYFIESNGTEVQVNSSSAIWTRPKSSITEEQYKEFYKKVAIAGDDPWLILHNKNEGIVEYTNLLFIPTNKTFDLFHPDRKRRVRLYIKRVFISEEGIDLIPQYMRFLRGIIDSEDLPLNISRETLQHNSVVEKIKSSITKRVISELKNKLTNARSEYEKFWNNFGAVLKEGLCEGLADSEKLLEVCLFYSALHNKLITLDEYIASPNQEAIYYLSGDDVNKLKNSPQIEGFINKGIDVLLFTDSVDDFWANVVPSYKEKEIKSVTRADISLNNEDTKEEGEKDINQQNIIDYFKDCLKDQVQDVIISKKLTTSPVCLAVDSTGMDIRMEKFLIEQKQLASSKAKILEINNKHKIIEKIAKDVEAGTTTEQTSDLVHLLFDEACINEDLPLKDPGLFLKRLNNFIERNI